MKQSTRLGGADVEPIDTDFVDFFNRETKGQVQRATLLLGSVDEANDVVQEVMTKLYELWDSVADPGPYLNRAVLNLCRDRGRRHGVQTRAISKLSSQLATFGANNSPEILDDVLADLPFNQRAAVVLRYWGGFSFEEIAVELGCSTGSIGPWINRALTTVGKALA